MEILQLKRYFNELFGENLTLSGVLVSLTDISLITIRGKKDTYKFVFEITNPNDVSFYLQTVRWDIQDLLTEFETYISVKTQYHLLNEADNSNLYFNNNAKTQIQSVLNGIKTIKFGNLPKYKIFIDSVGFKQYYDDELIQIYNQAVPIGGTKDGIDVNVRDVIEEYYDFLEQNETYYESENIYQSLDVVLGETIGNSGDIVYEYRTNFIL
jgi:hypothetical protein